jgi:hypothetical protein
MTALGDGVLDLPAIVAAAPWVAARVVEIDACAGDMLEALGRSRQYLGRLLEPVGTRR